MDQNDKPRYIIQLSGPDIPGTLNTATRRLRLCGFTLQSVSISSGADVQSTFITCERINDESSVKHDSMRDREFLRRLMMAAVEDLDEDKFKEYNIIITLDKNQDSRNEITTSPTRVSNNQNDNFRIFAHVYMTNEPGIIADVTTLLRPNFTIDAIDTRPADRPPANPPTHVGEPYQLGMLLIQMKWRQHLQDNLENSDPLIKLIQDELRKGLNEIRSQRKECGNFDVNIEAMESQINLITKNINLINTSNDKDQLIFELIGLLHDLLLQLKWQAGYDIFVSRIYILDKRDNPFSLHCKFIEGEEPIWLPEIPNSVNADGTISSIKLPELKSYFPVVP